MDDKRFIEMAQNFKEYICKQTLCDNLTFGDLSGYEKEDIHEIEIDGYKIKLLMKESDI